MAKNRPVVGQQIILEDIYGSKVHATVTEVASDFFRAVTGAKGVFTTYGGTHMVRNPGEHAFPLSQKWTAVDKF